MIDMTCVDIEGVVTALKRSMCEVVRFQTNTIDGTLTIALNDGTIIVVVVQRPVIH